MAVARAFAEAATDGLTGRTVLVTGAGGGIGGAIVHRLVALGAKVIAADLDDARLAGVVDSPAVTPLAFDLTCEASVREALQDCDVDGLVNCAGYAGPSQSPQDTDITIFDRTVAVNARGALLAIQCVAPAMIRRSHGSIVNVSSQASLVALHGHLSYAASKAALDSITRVSALELGPRGVRVNSVNPTAVMTPMSVEHWTQPDIAGPYLSAMPLGRWASVEDVVAPVVFLLSKGAAMITGVCLPVDGGYTCQ